MKLRFEILRFSLLYQAFEGQHQLVGYPDGKALDAEMLVYLHRAEVRAQRAVSLTGDCDVVALEHMRIVLTGSRWNGLDERVVRVVAAIIIVLHIRVAAQNALIVLTRMFGMMRCDAKSSTNNP